MSGKKTNIENYVKKTFGGKLRVRVSGLLFREGKLLILKHKIDDYHLWAPPGGGIEFGDSIQASLIKEFKEEVKLDIKVNEFLFLTEHLDPPLHAIELFYHVSSKDFNVALGTDPEIEGYNILKEFRFVDGNDLARIDNKELHSSLKSCTNPIELLDKQGHLK